ncbi:hypothetical protein ACER0C_022274 [Sarotherodon galilaeus]
MNDHSEQRRNFQSKSFQEGTGLHLLPPRLRTSTGTWLSSRDSERLGLQVQGYCCPLLQRPSSGRVIPQSRGGGNEKLFSSIRVRLESRAKPASRSKTGSRPEMTSQSGAPTVSQSKDPVDERTETSRTPCDSERPARYTHPASTKVSELHLYLPSSLCEDEKQDRDGRDVRHLSEETSAEEDEVKLTISHTSHTSEDEPNPGLSNPQHNTDTN